MELEVEPESNRKRSRVFTAVVLGVILGVPCLLSAFFLLRPVLLFAPRFRAVVGKTEAAAVQELGPPAFTVSKADATRLGVDFNWRDEGFVPVPTRPVSKEVLLY